MKNIHPLAPYLAILIGFQAVMGPLEIIYFWGYSTKKIRSLKNQKRLPHKVISVGNITTGGTGKTPAVIALAAEAGKRGFYPVILTRGYKGKAKGPCFVNKGNGPLLSAAEAGDEPFLMSELLRNVPIVKYADRYRGGMFALNELRPQPSAVSLQSLLFILDDGFQHWRLYRDTDILLIDSTNPFGNRKLIPSGILREPLSEIKRADVVVITKTKPIQLSAKQNTETESLMKEVCKYNPDAPIFLSEHKPICLRTFSGKELPLGILSGENVVGFCGIGNPGSFKNTLIQTNARLKEFTAFRDHFKYAHKNISGIKETARKHSAGWIVTTEKDIIRLRGFDLPDNLVSLGIKFSIDEKFYDKVFAEV